VAALAAPAAAAVAGQPQDDGHGRHHGRHHHVRHHIRHHHGHKHHHFFGLPDKPFVLRNVATGSCLSAEAHAQAGEHNSYSLAECAAQPDRAAMWTIDSPSGALRNLATDRCVVPGYVKDFSCAKLAEHGKGYAIQQDAEGRIFYRSIAGERYLSVVKHTNSAGYGLGVSHTMETSKSTMGMQQRWMTPAA
jgi:hypothetical protein